MIHSHSELLRPRAWEVKESPNNLRYQGCFRLGEIPADWTRWQVAGVSAGSENRVYLFHRGHDVPPVLCFDTDGKLLFSWDHISFGHPHIVTVDVDDNVWLTDDGSYIIYKLSPQGEVLFTLGTKDVSEEDCTHFN